MEQFEITSLAALMISALLVTWLWARRRGGARRKPAEEHLDTVQSWKPQAVRVLTLPERKAFDLMRNISADENHHFVFYRGVLAAMLRESPSTVLEGVYNTFLNFQMPGTGIPGFLRRSIEIAKAGVYNLRVHHDNVVLPLLQYWRIADLTDLTSTGAEFQDRIMALPAKILAGAERFERRFGPMAVPT